MKILHITDSHGTVKSPESRTDLYYLTFLRKFAEIGYQIKLHKVDMVLHTGDLFHTSRVSNKFMGQVAEIIKSWGVPLYVVPGNHDIDGYTIDTIDQTSLGLLAKTGVLTLLTRDNPITVEAEQNGNHFTVAISGQEYYSDIDTGNTEDFEMQQTLADINILAIHGYIADTQQHPNIRCTYPKDIITDADIILSGHYHRSFAIDMGDVSYYNPGSMLRVEMTDYNKNNMPQFGILEIELDNQGYVVYDYKFHNFRVAQPSTSVFDYNTVGVIKKHSITLENFKTSISNTMQTLNVNTGTTYWDTIKNTIEEYCNAQSYDVNRKSKLKIKAGKVCDNALAKTIDEDAVVVKGFIPAKTPIKIKSIDIENFQSHENTHIDFNNGLNIIVGESNNGKTSILRAMDWVIDNQPLGTDFIMIGKTYCKVRITYDNGAYIERYRTLKDTGYYKVWDGNPQNVEQTYKGFTNNVPVEVMNIHQMPKVIVTKNTETHLNKLSQLEGPFLITESVNEKASAIGRITGTNVIDVAIKDVSHDITYNNKQLKEAIKAKEDLEVQIKKMDINNLVNLKKKYSEAFAKIVSIKQLEIDSTRIQNEDKQCKTNIIKYTDIINDCQTVINYKTEIESAQNLIKTLTDMIMLIRKYEYCKSCIQDTEQKIKTYNEIIKDKEVIDKCNDIIFNIHSFIPLLTKYSNCQCLIDSHKNNIGILNRTTSKKYEITDAESIINALRTVLKLYSDNLFLQQAVQTSNDNSACILAELNCLSKEIEEQESAMKEYILSNKICPCCGQKVSDSHVTNIINNFSKEV